MKNINVILMISLALIIPGCTTYGKCPAVPKIEYPDYAVNHVSRGASSEEKFKAIFITYAQCDSALKSCLNVNNVLN